MPIIFGESNCRLIGVFCNDSWRLHCVADGGTVLLGNAFAACTKGQGGKVNKQ